MVRSTLPRTSPTAAEARVAGKKLQEARYSGKTVTNPFEILEEELEDSKRNRQLQLATTGDQIRKAVENLPDEQRSAIKWLSGYNRCGCAIVIAMTNEGHDLIITGPHRKKLQQLWRRRIAPLFLTAVPMADDLIKFADAFGLTPAPLSELTVQMDTTSAATGRTKQSSFSIAPFDVQTKVCKEDGLGVWLSLLQDASDMAKEQKRPISWGAVIKAYCIDKSDREIVQ